MVMVLFTHILIALSSLVFITVLFFAPSSAKFRISYALIMSTIASGCLLTVLTPSHLLHACITGILYTAIVIAGIAAAQHKFARQQI